jgi:hypothetical protein
MHAGEINELRQIVWPTLWWSLDHLEKNLVRNSPTHAQEEADTGAYIAGTACLSLQILNLQFAII